MQWFDNLFAQVRLVDINHVKFDCLIDKTLVLWALRRLRVGEDAPAHSEMFLIWATS